MDCRHESTESGSRLGADRGFRFNADGQLSGCFEASGDVTVEKLRADLVGQGLHFGYGTLWRFLARHRLTTRKTARATEQGRPEERWLRKSGQLDKWCSRP